MADKDHTTLYGLPAYKAYTLVNLPVVRAVQKVYVGTNNLYAIQRYGENVYFSKADISNGKTTADFSASAGGSHMILEGFGHGQTLDWYSHNGTEYFLVATKPNTAGWATQIGRVSYKAGATISGNTAITRISSLNHATSNGASIGTTLRVEAAVSTSHKEILVLSMNQNTSGTNTKSVFTRYDLTALNNVWDNIGVGGYIGCDKAEVFNTVVDSWEIDGDLYSKVANRSIQGLDLSDGAAIYISSGNQGEYPTISKWYWKGTPNKGKVIDNYYWPIDNGTSPAANSLVETEGLQLKDVLYVGIAYHTQPKSVTFENGNTVSDNLVYRVDKSLFS